MPGLRSILRRFSAILSAAAPVALILFVITLTILVVKQLFPIESLKLAYTTLDILSLLSGVAVLFGFFYQRKERAKKSAELKSRLSSEVLSRINSITETVQHLVPKFKGLSKEEIESLRNRYWNEYQSKERFDPDLEYDFVQDVFGMISDSLSLGRGQKLFLVHIYLMTHQMDLLQRFLNSLHKASYTKEGAPENIYSRLMSSYASDPDTTLNELMQRISNAKREDIEKVATQNQGQQILIQKISEIAEDKKRFASLKRIVQRIVIGGYVSEKGLLSLMTNGDDLCIIIKSEAGVSGLKTVFLKGREVTPFKKSLLEHGFIQPSRGSAGTFLARTNNLPAEYRNNLPRFLENVIIPEVETEWKALQNKYAKQDFKRLRNVTYSYLCFTVRRDNVGWGTHNTQLRPSVEDLLISLNMKETATAIASHIYEIPAILKKMEIDALTDSATSSMKQALRLAEEQIRKGLASQGINIIDVSDYRQVDISAFAALIKEYAKPELEKIAPKARRKFTTENSTQIGNEIKSNASDLYNLVNRLGVSI